VHLSQPPWVSDFIVLIHVPLSQLPW
jgi:hypothetical protein